MRGFKVVITPCASGKVQTSTIFRNVSASRFEYDNVQGYPEFPIFCSCGPEFELFTGDPGQHLKKLIGTLDPERDRI